MRFILAVFLFLVVSACSSQQPVSSAMPVLEPGAEVVQEMVVTPTEPVAEASSNSSSASSDGPDSSSTIVEAVREFAIEAYNFGWDPAEIRVNKGDRVKLILSSHEGTHGFGLRDFNIDVGPISPGMSPQMAEFVADKTGSFEFRCNVPCGSGHRDMKGKLFVE